MATKITVTEIIYAPKLTVWRIIMNEENLKFWLTGIQLIEHIGGEPGTVGSKSKIIFLEGRKKISMHEEVLKMKEPDEYVFKLVHSSLYSYCHIYLTVFGLSTMIKQVVEIYPRGFFSRLFMPFMKTSMKERMQNDLSRLKKYIENRSNNTTEKK